MQIVYELAQYSQPSKMQLSLDTFSKYNKESALGTFVVVFINKANLCGIADENILRRTF